MIRITPQNPAISPATPSGRTLSRKIASPARATISGMEEAMIAASDASILRMATKNRPR